MCQFQVRFDVLFEGHFLPDFVCLLFPFLADCRAFHQVLQ